MEKNHPHEQVEQPSSEESLSASEEKSIQPPEKNFEEEIALLKDQLLRALAEVDNTQKRAHKEKEDTQKYAIAGFARDLLSIEDTLERALGSIPLEERQKDGFLKTLCEGLKLTHDELTKVFSKHKIEVVNPVNAPFDPALHQAVSQVESPDHKTGTVVQVFQKGYTLHGRLLRPAMVTVAK